MRALLLWVPPGAVGTCVGAQETATPISPAPALCCPLPARRPNVPDRAGGGCGAEGDLVRQGAPRGADSLKTAGHTSAQAPLACGRTQ